MPPKRGTPQLMICLPSGRSRRRLILLLLSAVCSPIEEFFVRCLFSTAQILLCSRAFFSWQLVFRLRKNGGTRRFFLPKNTKIFPPQSLPDQLLPKIASDQFLASERQLIGQVSVADEGGHGRSESCDIAHWKEQAGFAIHQ